MPLMHCICPLRSYTFPLYATIAHVCFWASVDKIPMPILIPGRCGLQPEDPLPNHHRKALLLAWSVLASGFVRPFFGRTIDYWGTNRGQNMSESEGEPWKSLAVGIARPFLTEKLC